MYIFIHRQTEMKDKDLVLRLLGKEFGTTNLSLPRESSGQCSRDLQGWAVTHISCYLRRTNVKPFLKLLRLNNGSNTKQHRLS